MRDVAKTYEVVKYKYVGPGTMKMKGSSMCYGEDPCQAVCEKNVKQRQKRQWSSGTHSNTLPTIT